MSKVVFDHIEQAHHSMFHLFESGLSGNRRYDTGGFPHRELRELADAAEEVGLAGGAGLFRELVSALTALSAGQAPVYQTVKVFSNLVSYYDMVKRMLIVETMTAQAPAIIDK